MNNLTKEILRELVKETRSELPFTLEVKHLVELTGYGKATIYRMLEQNEIPGAKKIRGWRIPRDVFLAWWFGNKIEEENDDVIDLAL